MNTTNTAAKSENHKTSDYTTTSESNQLGQSENANSSFGSGEQTFAPTPPQNPKSRGASQVERMAANLNGQKTALQRVALFEQYSKNLGNRAVTRLAAQHNNNNKTTSRPAPSTNANNNDKLQRSFLFEDSHEQNNPLLDKPWDLSTDQSKQTVTQAAITAIPAQHAQTTTQASEISSKSSTGESPTTKTNQMQNIPENHSKSHTASPALKPDATGKQTSASQSKPKSKTSTKNTQGKGTARNKTTKTLPDPLTAAPPTQTPTPVPHSVGDMLTNSQIVVDNLKNPKNWKNKQVGGLASQNPDLQKSSVTNAPVTYQSIKEAIAENKLAKARELEIEQTQAQVHAAQQKVAQTQYNSIAPTPPSFTATQEPVVPTAPLTPTPTTSTNPAQSQSLVTTTSSSPYRYAGLDGIKEEVKGNYNLISTTPNGVDAQGQPTNATSIRSGDGTRLDTNVSGTNALNNKTYDYTRSEAKGQYFESTDNGTNQTINSGTGQRSNTVLINENSNNQERSTKTTTNISGQYNNLNKQNLTTNINSGDGTRLENRRVTETNGVVFDNRRTDITGSYRNMSDDGKTKTINSSTSGARTEISENETNPNGNSHTFNSTTLKGNWDNSTVKADGSSSSRREGQGTAYEETTVDVTKSNNAAGLNVNTTQTSTNSTQDGSWTNTDVKNTIFKADSKEYREGKVQEVSESIKAATGNQNADAKVVKTEEGATTTTDTTKNSDSTTKQWKDYDRKVTSYNQDFTLNPDGKLNEISEATRQGNGTRYQQSGSTENKVATINGDVTTTDTISTANSVNNLSGKWNEKEAKATTFDPNTNRDRKTREEITKTSTAVDGSSRNVTELTQERKRETLDKTTGAYKLESLPGSQDKGAYKYNEKTTVSTGKISDTERKVTDFSNDPARLNKDGKLREEVTTIKNLAADNSSRSVTEKTTENKNVTFTPGAHGQPNTSTTISDTTKDTRTTTKGPFREAAVTKTDYSLASPNNKDFKLNQTAINETYGDGTRNQFEVTVEKGKKVENSGNQTVTTIGLSEKKTGTDITAGSWGTRNRTETNYGAQNLDKKERQISDVTTTGAGNLELRDKTTERDKIEKVNSDGTSYMKTNKQTEKSTVINGTTADGKAANWNTTAVSETYKRNGDFNKTTVSKSGTGEFSEVEKGNEVREETINGERNQLNYTKNNDKTTQNSGSWKDVTDVNKREGLRSETSKTIKAGDGTRYDRTRSREIGYVDKEGRDRTDNRAWTVRNQTGKETTTTTSSTKDYLDGIALNKRTNSFNTNAFGFKGFNKSTEDQITWNKPKDKTALPPPPKRSEVTLWEKTWTDPTKNYTEGSRHYGVYKDPITGEIMDARTGKPLPKNQQDHYAGGSLTNGAEYLHSDAVSAKLTDRNISLSENHLRAYGAQATFTRVDKGKIAGIDASNQLDAKAFGGVEGKYGGSLQAGMDGVQAKYEASAFAGVRGNVADTTKVGNDNLNVTNITSGEAMVGGNAKGTAQTVVDPRLGQILLSGEASAFAGAKINGADTVSLNVLGHPLGTVTVDGEASAGIGATAGGNFSIDWKTGTISLGGKLAATLGVGLGAGAQAKLSFKEAALLGLDLARMGLEPFKKTGLGKLLIASLGPEVNMAGMMGTDLLDELPKIAQALGAIKDNGLKAIQSFMHDHPEIQHILGEASHLMGVVSNQISQFVADPVGYLKNASTKLFQMGSSALQTIAGPLIQMFQPLQQMGSQAVQNFHQFVGNISQMASSGMAQARQITHSVIQGIQQGVTGLLSYGNQIKSDISSKVRQVIQTGQQIWQGVQSAGQTVASFGQSVVSSVSSRVSGAISQAQSSLSSLTGQVSGLASSASSMVSQVSSTFSGVTSAASSMVSGAMSRIAGLSPQGQGVLSFLQGLVGQAMSAVSAVVGSVVPGAKEAMAAAQAKLERGRAIVNGAVSGAQPLGGQAQATASQVQSTASQQTSQAQSTAQSAISAGQEAHTTAQSAVASGQAGMQAAQAQAQAKVASSHQAVQAAQQKTQGKIQETHAAVQQTQAQANSQIQASASAVQAVPAQVQAKASGVQAKAGAAWQGATASATGVVGAVQSIWNQAAAFAQSLVAKAQARASTVQNQANTAGQAVLSHVPTIEQAGAAAKSSVQAGYNAFSHEAEALWNMVPPVAQQGATALGSGIQAIGNQAQQAGRTASTTAHQTREQVSEIVTSAANRAETMGQQVVTGGQDVLDSLIAATRGQAEGVIGEAKSAISEAIGQAHAWVEQAHSLAEPIAAGIHAKSQQAVSGARTASGRFQSTAHGQSEHVHSTGTTARQGASQQEATAHQQSQTAHAASQQEATQGHARGSQAQASTQQHQAQLEQHKTKAIQESTQAISELQQTHAQAQAKVSQEHSKVAQTQAQAGQQVSAKLSGLQAEHSSAMSTIQTQHGQISEAQSMAQQTVASHTSQIQSAVQSGHSQVQSKQQQVAQQGATAQGAASAAQGQVSATGSQVESGVSSASSQIESARG